MATRPFFVLPGGDCIPLEGDWRAEELRGEWYVLGHHTVVACDSESDARRTLADLGTQTDADRLALEAIEGMDFFPADDPPAC